MNPGVDPTGSTPPKQNDYYPTTLWTQIIRARETGNDAQEAWKILFGRYATPIQAQISKHLGTDPEGYTSEFFGCVFAQKLVQNADRSRGRFRSFLAEALRNFINTKLRAIYADKRGKGISPISLDATPTALPLGDTTDPESFGRNLDRAIAEETMNKAYQQVRSDYVQTKLKGGSPELEKRLAHEFELLLAPGAKSDAETALLLGASQGAVRVTRHRWNRKLRDAFLRQVADLVAPPDVEEEVRYFLKLIA